ncbi:hypothetical protein [Deinococcus soli (ex Cha et al. 2016)]|uniref:Uncharacterized protein n=2 Tax=Deinococcus soli (ex Cha et al. 2016) TaxID=1309411 RepID=A0ACC6KKW5_9DEIO|nr:hypothetical protein [Deinococcus soli (ex Cha et al. 2016)]MDR6218733.1 hypothetical protein [Deinococcus soli (ex Cha et al. 2016)]MDR6328530.1 hypothetical protein [Deinococcus soli (ex Cha et al. 2016)]MDR6753141.1 hypothetical protein [Deinococcus soli (ex Cha et al. 2016)]
MTHDATLTATLTVGHLNWPDHDTPTWAEPDWAAITAAMIAAGRGIRAVTVTTQPGWDTPGSSARQYTMTLQVNARECATDASWDLISRQFQEAGEPVTAAGILEVVYGDEGGLPEELGDLLDPIFRHLHGAAYDLEFDSSQRIANAAD